MKREEDLIIDPKTDARFMKMALRLAKKAGAIDEVPIGAVLVKDGVVVGRGYNQRNTKKNPLKHAEILAIDQAARKTGDWRLEDCTLYVTLEPCPMCAGAIVQARIDRVVIGARSHKAGSAGSIVDILNQPGFNHRVYVTDGVLEEECSSILSEFFRRLREKKASPSALDSPSSSC